MELKRTPVIIAGGPPVFAKGTAVAASLIGVTALAKPEYNLEITVFAAIP